MLSCALSPPDELRRSARLLGILREALLREEPGRIVVFPGAPRDWFAPEARVEFERLRTGAGAVSARCLALGDARRVLVEVDLPELGRGGREPVIRLPPPPGRTIEEVRIDGRRSSRFRPLEGTVLLPRRRSVAVAVTLSGGRGKGTRGDRRRGG